MNLGLDYLDAAPEKNEEEQIILKNIMQGGDEKVESILLALNKEYAIKQPLARLSDPYAQDVVRATFGLLLKITDSMFCWKIVYEAIKTESTPDEKDMKKLASIWATASRMRMTYAEKKKAITTEGQGEQWEKELKLIANSIKDKVELLLKFKSAAIEEQEGLKATTKMQVVSRESDEKELAISQAEQVKNRLGKWKNVQMAVAKDENKETSLSSSALQILESDFTAAQLISRLESYYSRGIILYGVINICEKAIFNINSKKIRSDVLAWIFSILNKTSVHQWHYTQLTTSCGVAFQLVLRSAFFSVIGQVLEYISQVKHSKEVNGLLNALKWNFTASDHIHIHKLGLLPTLGASSQNNVIANLWGQPLSTEDSTSEQLLATFEFITIKIATRILLSPDKSRESLDDPAKELMPNLERSRSMFDAGSTAKIFESIMKIIFGEVKRVVESYDTTQGMDIKQVETFKELSKKTKDESEEDITKDKKKLMKELTDTTKTGYSHEFCVRILRLLYHLCLAVQEDPQFNTSINLCLDETDCLHLLKLLHLGSTQQQFLILQIIPLMAKFCFEFLERAAAHYQESQHKPLTYTKSFLADILLIFALERREGIWFSTVCIPPGGYSISKCAIASIRAIANINKEIGLALGSLIQNILIGTKETWSTLPVACKNKRFIELILSIAGGEADSLYKGAKGHAFGRKGYSIVCFTTATTEKDKEKKYDWDFLPKIHNEIMVHLSGNEASTGSNSLEKVPVSEFVPQKTSTILASSVQNIKKEILADSIKKILVANSTSENSILQTILVKTIKVIQIILKGDKELNKMIFSEELFKQLLSFAIQPPKSSINRSLSTTELALEEIRKITCQTEGKTLSIAESSTSSVKVDKNSLIFCLTSGNFIIPMTAYKSIGKFASDAKFEYIKYGPDTNLETIFGKIFILPKEHFEKVEWAKVCKQVTGIVTDENLSKIVEKMDKSIILPLIEISTKNMKRLDGLFVQLKEVEQHIQNTKLDQLISEYINVKSEKPINSTNVREIVKELLNEKDKEKEPEKEKKKEDQAKSDPLRIFTLLNSKCENIFKDKNDQMITQENDTLKKEFSTSYSRIFDRSENPNPDVYMKTLEDLRLFYIRRILTILLMENPVVFSALSPDDFKNLFSFMQIISIEADYLQYGTGNKAYSKKVNKILTPLMTGSNGLNNFLIWLHEQVKKVKEKAKPSSFSIFTSTQEDLLNDIYGKFVHRCIRILLKLKQEELIKHDMIGDLLTDLLTLIASIENVPDKHRCMLTIKRIMGAAEAMQNTLPLKTFNSILTCKCIKALAKYYNELPQVNSIMWKNGNEVMLKANSLFRTAAIRYGEEARTYCIKDDSDLYPATEVMKTFPDFKKLLFYSWCRLYSKEIKLKAEIRLETPKPFYNTQYCLLINDPLAESFEINSKRQTTSI